MVFCPVQFSRTPVGILSVTTTVVDHQVSEVALFRFRKSSRTGVHHVSVGLLQFATVWRCDYNSSRTLQHLLSGARHSEHITPVLRQLHWLPVKQRMDAVEYKLATMTYKAVHGLWPSHLAGDVS